MRLDKLLVHSGFGSRKDVKQMLKKKMVMVDNKIVKKADVQVDPNKAEIYVNGERLVYLSSVYLMLHKPPGHVSATVDNRHPTVIDLVPKELNHYDLAPVGRLDKDTEGLLILTNDGQLNHRLTSPKHDVFKTYYATIDGHVKEAHIKQFEDGVTLDDGYRTKPARLTIITAGEHSEIEIAISEGKFHQVKRMFEAIDMKVTYLKRTSMGDLQLDPNIPMGQTRMLTDAEISYLKNV